MRDKTWEFLCIGKKKSQITFAWDEVSHDTELDVRNTSDSLHSGTQKNM